MIMCNDCMCGAPPDGHHAAGLRAGIRIISVSISIISASNIISMGITSISILISISILSRPPDGRHAAGLRAADDAAGGVARLGVYIYIYIYTCM